MPDLQHARFLGIWIVALAIASMAGLVAPPVRAQSSGYAIGVASDDDGAYLGVRLTEDLIDAPIGRTGVTLRRSRPGQAQDCTRHHAHEGEQPQRVAKGRP